MIISNLYNESVFDAKKSTYVLFGYFYRNISFVLKLCTFIAENEFCNFPEELNKTKLFLFFGRVKKIIIIPGTNIEEVYTARQKD